MNGAFGARHSRHDGQRMALIMGCFHAPVKADCARQPPGQQASDANHVAFVDRIVDEIGQSCHRLTGEAARIDACKRRQISRYIERQAVKGTTTPDLHSDRCDLCALDKDAGRARLAMSEDAEFGEKFDDDGLQCRHKRAYAQSDAVEIQQWVGDELTGSVVGNLPAANGLNDRNVAGIEHVLGFAGQSLGIDRRMLQQSQFVGRVRVASIGERAHRRPALQVRPATKFADLEDWCAHSVTTTTSSARRLE